MMSDEYLSLKNEYKSYQEKQNSSNPGVISLVVALLTFSIVLYDQTKDIFLERDIYATRLNILMVMIRILGYLLPLFILSFLSIKIERNYRQALSISIYLQVIYEYPSSRGKTLSWERDRQALLGEQGKQINWYEKLLEFLNKKFINIEIYVVSCFVSLLQTVLIVIELYEIWYLIVGVNFIYCIIFAFIPSGILFVFQSIIMHNTSIKKLKERYVMTIKNKIVQIAIEKEVISSAQEKDCLDFVVID